MITDYAIPSKYLYKILKEKKVNFLYHANTLATSLTLINARCLFSRHQVEIDGLVQSSQKSDAHDRKHDVWDHVYVDGTDHHSVYKRPNFYGPVFRPRRVSRRGPCAVCPCERTFEQYAFASFMHQSQHGSTQGPLRETLRGHEP